jgi:hypothetical protein
VTLKIPFILIPFSKLLNWNEYKGIWSVTLKNTRKIMKHVILGRKWNFASYMPPSGSEPLHFGFFSCQNFDEINQDSISILSEVWPGERYILPENAFKVVKTQSPVTIEIVRGFDPSNNVLLFSNVKGGFRGGCEILSSTTTGEILLVAQATAANRSGISFAALLKPNQVVDISSYGLFGHFIFRFSNKRGKIEKTKITKEVYSSLKRLH